MLALMKEESQARWIGQKRYFFGIEEHLLIEIMCKYPTPCCTT